MSQSNIIDSLVVLIQQYDAMTHQQSQDPEGESIVKAIRLIGATAYYLGSQEAMLRLLNEAQSKASDDGAITHSLDRMWHRVGTWIS